MRDVTLETPGDTSPFHLWARLNEIFLRSVHGMMSQDTNDFLFASYTPCSFTMDDTSNLNFVTPTNHRKQL
jgi:hypothetical protein